MCEYQKQIKLLINDVTELKEQIKSLKEMNKWKKDEQMEELWDKMKKTECSELYSDSYTNERLICNLCNDKIIIRYDQKLNICFCCRRMMCCDCFKDHF